MLHATDTLIEYLAANLTGIVPVHWVRQTPNDENAGVMQQDALNVRALGFWEVGSLEKPLVSLDLLGSDERTVMTQLQAIRDVLIQEQTIPEKDYSDPVDPELTGKSVFWEGMDLRFIKVRTPKGSRYVHYNCTFPITHTRE
jgi:hypothetical protein